MQSLYYIFINWSDKSSNIQQYKNKCNCHTKMATVAVSERCHSFINFDENLIYFFQNRDKWDKSGLRPLCPYFLPPFPFFTFYGVNRVFALRFHGWGLRTVKTNTHKKRLRCSSDFTILRLFAKWLKIALLIH